MERNTTTKKLFGCVLALSCAFVLGACDPVEALPANYNDPILEYVTGDKAVDTDDNIMGKIYDAICGNKNEKVLNILLEELAERKFGTYTEIMEAKKDAAKRTAYIAKYAEIFSKEGDTTAVSEARFDIFAQDIQDRVSEAFYNLITSGSYNNMDTGKFDEEKLYTKLDEELWDLQSKSGVTFKQFYVTDELTKENALSHLNDLYSVAKTEANPKARGYIEKKVFPQIIKDKLVEEYIFEENYAALGRSYARKVNFVKVSYDDSSLDYSQYLTKEFAKNTIYDTSINGSKLKFDIIKYAIRGFDALNVNAGTDGTVPLILNSNGKTYTSAYEASYQLNLSFVNKGLSIKGDDENLGYVVIPQGADNKDYTTIDGTVVLDTTQRNTYIFADTKLGELFASYKKALKAKADRFVATAEDKAELEKFSSGKSLPDALREKVLALAKESSEDDGWFVKGSGISGLPSAITDRLFNINVANDLDKANGYVLETSGTYGNYRYVDGDPSKALLTKVPYIRNINGCKLVMTASPIDWTLDNDNFIYSDGSAFYICQVLEAPSTAKLNLESDAAYKTGNVIDAVKVETIAREVSKVLSTKDTYVTNAYTKYINDLFKNMSFGDSSLYDYLKSQYPDLDIFENDED